MTLIVATIAMSTGCAQHTSNQAVPAAPEHLVKFSGWQGEDSITRGMLLNDNTTPIMVPRDVEVMINGEKADLDSLRQGMYVELVTKYKTVVKVIARSSD